MSNRSGVYHTNLTGDMAYRSYMPAPLPPNPPLALDEEAVALLVRANRQLSSLDKMTDLIPDIGLFVSMYVRKESLMSSQIEGTQATLDDVLSPHVDSNANQNITDVVNYVRATEFALARLNELPLCNRLLRETHAVLMAGVRGQEKSPGEFRITQNWIGGAGSTIRNARFIPPSPQDMTEALSDLEKYMNANDNLDPLIRAGLIHYQFETIHPFLDGNGRVGRLLITLYLMHSGILKSPALYISYFLKKNRIEYYDRLSEVRRTGNYEQWVKFFLTAVIESAEDAISAINKLSALRQKNTTLIHGLTKKTASSLLQFYAYLEECPIVETTKTAAALSISYNAASAAIKRLCDMGILVPTSDARRNRVFSYEAYLDILRDGT